MGVLGDHLNKKAITFFPKLPSLTFAQALMLELVWFWLFAMVQT